jgi:hypothetical protein
VEKQKRRTESSELTAYSSQLTESGRIERGGSFDSLCWCMAAVAGKGRSRFLASLGMTLSFVLALSSCDAAFQEIPEELGAGGAAFFGVKLGGVNVVVFDDGGEGSAVGAESDGFAVGFGGGEGMGEVEEGVGGYVGEKARGAGELELVPAHVREFDGGGEGRDVAGKKVKAVEVGSFLTGFVESLEAEADAEERDAALDGGDEWGAELAFVEGAD